MWRVVLSVAAAVFDGVMLVFMSLALIGILNGPTVRPARHLSVPSATFTNSVHTTALILIGVITAGFCLNLLALGFGARLPVRQRASVASIASEFA
jgi:hypothetical protein